MSDTPLHGYQSYRGLPSLAGLGTIEQAAKPGPGVEECVTRLKRYHYAFVRLHEIFTARITAEPIYELKTAFSHHAYLCAEHVQSLRTRVGEMREPPLGLEAVPHPALEVFFDEILAAPARRRCCWACTRRRCRRSARRWPGTRRTRTRSPMPRRCASAASPHSKLADMIDFGTTQHRLPRRCREAIDQELVTWLDLLDRVPWQRRAGWMAPRRTIGQDRLQRQHSATPYVYDPSPKRDERFQDLYNQGVNAESFLYNPEFPARAQGR